MTVSDDVREITFHNLRPFITHFHAGPFLFLYSLWVAHFFQGYYSLEVEFLILAFIGVIHVLSCLFCMWSVRWRVLSMYSTVADPFNATTARVMPTENNGSTVLCVLQKYKTDEGNSALCFEFQKTKYCCEKGTEFRAVAFPIDEHIQNYIDSRGLSDDDVKKANLKWGPNKMEIVLPTFQELFVERATAPFFVFQVFCVLLWCLDEYWYYSLFTLAMLALFEATVVKQQMKSMSEIKNMTQEPYTLNVYRNKRWEKVKSTELYPGDIVSVVRRAEIVPCDLLLLHGQCVIDESMLTGESVPLMKEALIQEDGGCLYKPDDNLNLDIHSRLHIVSGGTKVIQHNGPTNKNVLRAPDSGSIAYVLRTGFNTSQGKLLRTIMYSVQRVTANNFETFMFILFLLQFAIAASAYVWIEGIFCTEPFRIPFAGKVHFCCFDKTGTLTTDKLELSGVVGVSSESDKSDSKSASSSITSIDEAPLETCQVLATCHSLIHVDERLIGDPLEKAALQVLPWTLTKGDVAMCKTAKLSLKILKRFHFNSALKRMSVIVSKQDSSYNIQHLVMCKGAPEVIKTMLKEIPDNYDEVHTEYSLQGGRVIALARKELGGSDLVVRDVAREDAEKDLEFAGFVVFTAPLKKESKSAISMLKESSHYCIMITGDSPLTACYVAQQLRIAKKLLILTKNDKDGHWYWESPDKSVKFEIGEEQRSYSLCLTGEGMNYAIDTKDKKSTSLFSKIVKRIKVFARVTPKQKEVVITTLKSQGMVTVMCGDGTNDVGALKHADVGVAIISNAPEVKVEKSPKAIQKRQQAKAEILQQFEQAKRSNDPRQRIINKQRELEDKLKQLQLEEDTLVKLGDASIASPFTSKFSSVKCVCNIIRQGRCTLVTTLQMFKILALNALIIAYCQSALYLDGVKFSDGQATLQGLLLAGCFLFISRSKPLDKLSQSRPHANIFNTYTILTVLLQFAVHFYTLFTLVSRCHELSPRKESVDLEAEFEPNLLNSVVYILSVMLQLNTFVINYRGHPYMESLTENKPLCYSALGTTAIMISMTLGIFPQLNHDFSLVELPEDFRLEVLQGLVLDTVATFLVDKILLYICGDAKLKKID